MDSPNYLLADSSKKQSQILVEVIWVELKRSAEKVVPKTQDSSGFHEGLNKGPFRSSQSCDDYFLTVPASGLNFHAPNVEWVDSATMGSKP